MGHMMGKVGITGVVSLVRSGRRPAVGTDEGQGKHDRCRQSGQVQLGTQLVAVVPVVG